MLDVSGLLRSPRYRKGSTRLAQVLATGSLPAWTRYLDLAVPTKPADWDAELARTVATMSEAGRMKVLQKMCQTSPVDAGAQLANVRCPVLVVEGSADPDWTDPRAEGERILADLPEGLSEPRRDRGRRPLPPHRDPRRGPRTHAPVPRQDADPWLGRP